ncbi:restriction endonuclease subunit R [Microbacterium karelineae]|uniref:restriction endonuclease subunit R n=1 Tax=Microbacterium karelineae TaxID=2654283 RepID=UPI001E2FB8E6|nr:restriction endonuclease subunit R [Microbacterium karelineae]
MTLTALREDALTTTPAGFELRLSLPWIRSLPLSSLSGLELSVDGSAQRVRIRLGDRTIAATDGETGWWHLQDRVVVAGDAPLDDGHDVAVSFRLAIPYLPMGGEMLVIPIRERAPRHPMRTRLRGGGRPMSAPFSGRLAASAFNWTPQIVRAERGATDIAATIATDGIADLIEVEAGQAWRGFPAPADDEVDALRERLADAGARVSIVGASIDEWAEDGHRRDDDERLAFLLPQLRAASRVGAEGARLPIGQAGPALLARLQPVLHELDLVLFEEAQGSQTPGSDAHAADYDEIARLDDPHLRLLIDISMLMPALPTSYVRALASAGVDDALVRRLADGWRDPATPRVVMEALRGGAIPGSAQALAMDMIVRFGRSSADELREVLPLVGAFHLKFWDLDDADGRVSAPIRDVGSLLRGTAFRGTLCSEWGGHAWLDDDPAEMTSAHLALARRALGA